MAGHESRGSTGEDSEETSSEGQIGGAAKAADSSSAEEAATKVGGSDLESTKVDLKAAADPDTSNLKIGDATTQTPKSASMDDWPETTLDIDGDELENMRVETEQVDLVKKKASAPPLPASKPKSTNSKASAQTSAPPPVADKEEDANVGDVTAVTDLKANANLDAVDILAKRMDESAVGELAASDASSNANQSDLPLSARAKTVDISGEAKAAEGSGRPPTDEADALESSRQEALAANPLARSRGTSLPRSATESLLAVNSADEEEEQALAALVRGVRYRPPTRLAGIGSSIVLVAVAAFWIAGDGRADAKTSANSTNNEAVAAVVASDEDPLPTTNPETTSSEVEEEVAEPTSDDAEAVAAAAEARRAAREKAEKDRALRNAAETEEPEAAAEVTDPEETTDPATAEVDPELPTPVEAGEADPDPAASADPETPETPEAVVEKPEEPEEPVVAPVEKTPTPVTAPKLSKKQQRAAALAHYKKASSAFMKGNLSASERSFKAALKADSSLATSHRGLGLVYERRGNKSKAASSLRRYLRNAPRAKDAKAIRERLARLGK